MQTTEERAKIFGPDSWYGRMFLGHSPQTKERTLEQSSKKPPKSSAKKPPLFLYLRTDGQQQDASPVWEMGGLNGVSHGVYSMLSFGESPSVGAESHLSQILEDSPHQKYYLSARACQGILNRAAKRGKILPELLKNALNSMIEYWDESPLPAPQLASGKDATGYLMAAGYDKLGAQEMFSGDYTVVEPKPALLLNDQGGASIHCEDGKVSPTLRAEAHGNEPAVCYCIQGNCIDRSDTAGCNGAGWKEGTSYTLNTVDRPAVAFALEPGIAAREGGHIYEDVSGTIRAEPGDNRMSVAYSLDSLASNSMKSSNPYSGFHETDLSKTLDCSGPDPTKNQGGIAICQKVVGAVVFNEETVTSKTNASNPQIGDACHTLGASGAGRALCCMEVDNTPTICMDVGFFSAQEELAPSLLARGYKDPHIITVPLDNHPADSRVTIAEDGKVQTLTGRMGTGGGNVPMAMERREFVRQGADLYNGQLTGDVACTMTASSCAAPNRSGPSLVERVIRWVVRRLTPLECERLQGFPDGWTDIGTWTDSKGKVHKDADSPRYKALGNSIALPSWAYVLRKMSMYCGADRTMASLFDGIGGFPLIWDAINGDGATLWASEIEEFPIAVTKLRFPEK